MAIPKSAVSVPQRRQIGALTCSMGVFYRPDEGRGPGRGVENVAEKPPDLHERPAAPSLQEVPAGSASTDPGTPGGLIQEYQVAA